LETTSGPFVFDIARNLHQMKVRHEIIRACHGATVSTPALASYFRDVIGQKNVHVYPNTIVLKDYACPFKVQRDDPDEVRIIWQGSASHIVDWYPLRSAIHEVAMKYPKVKWVIFGEWFPFIHEAIPDAQVEHHSWVDYPAYKLYRTLLNADINLCPLVDNAFNRCKSAIKWYEASIMPRPEATLAQNTEPYKEIKDGVSGLLFDTPAEFVQKLSLLIEDAQLRQRLGAGAKKWVLENRQPEHTTPGLAEFYEDTRARQKRERTDTKPKIVAPTAQEIKRLARAR
jgi:glycosyltransferase involved in cell wall biosynthesis